MKFALLATLLSSSLSAQSFCGTVRGRVLHRQGAAAKTASVTLTDEEKSAARRTITNDQGEYTFAAVTPSTYRVTVSAPRLLQLGLRVTF